MSTPVPTPASAFSFTAPFPPSSSTSSPISLKQQRRVSLALPSSPRQFPAWSFRDDTSVGVGAGLASPSAALTSEKKGKMRRIANDSNEEDSASADLCVPTASTSSPAGVAGNSNTEPAKKPRKKWTMEETQMLVDGCNKVRHSRVSPSTPLLTFRQWGVGNWKAILNDPDLKFDNRSPVDLKDR